MDLEIARKLHFKTTENVATLDGTEELVDSCNCGWNWPCPVLGMYECYEANMRAISELSRLPRVIPKTLKHCHHFHAFDDTRFGDPARHVFCPTCHADWMELPAFPAVPDEEKL